MASKDTAIRALCRSLGKEYRVCTIDFEPVIYRDFGNGFNVEISGVFMVWGETAGMPDRENSQGCTKG